MIDYGAKKGISFKARGTVLCQGKLLLTEGTGITFIQRYSIAIVLLESVDLCNQLNINWTSEARVYLHCETKLACDKPCRTAKVSIDMYKKFCI